MVKNPVNPRTGIVIRQIGATFRLMKAVTQILTAVTTGILAAHASAEPLAVGADLPAVEQKNQDGDVVKLAEAGAKGYTLV